MRTKSSEMPHIAWHGRVLLGECGSLKTNHRPDCANGTLLKDRRSTDNSVSIKFQKDNVIDRYVVSY